MGADGEHDETLSGSEHIVVDVDDETEEASWMLGLARLRSSVFASTVRCEQLRVEENSFGIATKCTDSHVQAAKPKQSPRNYPQLHRVGDL